jgi:hypothetical protein
VERIIWEGARFNLIESEFEVVKIENGWHLLAFVFIIKLTLRLETCFPTFNELQQDDR